MNLCVCVNTRAQKEKEIVKRFSKIYMDPEVELCRQEEERKEHMRQEAAEEQRKIEAELKVFWGGLSETYVISSFTFQPSIHLPTVYPSLGLGGVEYTILSIGHEAEVQAGWGTSLFAFQCYSVW